VVAKRAEHDRRCNLQEEQIIAIALTACHLTKVVECATAVATFGDRKDAGLAGEASERGEDGAVGQSGETGVCTGGARGEKAFIVIDQSVSWKTGVVLGFEWLWAALVVQAKRVEDFLAEMSGHTV
jgi:hypothetical protein